MGELLDELARLSGDDLRRLVKEARAERRRRIRLTVSTIRSGLMPGASARKAARAISDVARGRGKRLDPELRAGIVESLTRELGPRLDDLPGPEMLRKFL